MQDATIERLSKIISSDSRPRGVGLREDKNSSPRRPAIRLRLHLDEGWFSLFLVATVVYSTIWSVQAAGWVDHLSILTLTTACGLIVGVISAKQQRFPPFLLHILAISLALLLAYWQTAGAFYAGNVGAFSTSIHRWVLLALSGGTSEDNSIFLFFITALGFALAYTSAWLVYRTRNPWLMITANAAVLLINLSNIASGYIIYLAVFLMASLLLMLRFNLYESVKRWRRQGLRYADDLGWDVMQAGAFISIGIIILSWLLPWGYTNDAAAQIWSLNSNPWVQLEATWSRIMSVSGGYNPANHGNFRDTLVLGGNPNLTNDVVFYVNSTDNSQYLASLSYDTYDGVQSWSVSPTSSQPLAANANLLAESSVVHSIQQVVNVFDPPGEQQSYLFGASQIASVDQPATVLYNQQSGSIVTVLTSSGKLVSGETYTIHSYVSSADENSLRAIPFPANAPTFPANFDGQFPITYYNPAVLQTYLQLPKSLDPNIQQKAQDVTAGSTSMYDKAMALQSYLQNNFTYSVNVRVPPGQETVSWFLFHNNDHDGYCTYFATAMAIMARTLGMPARIVSGYTNGTYDTGKHELVIKGTDAHTWTQIYFAGYGWINFEPSAHFQGFTRPTAGQFTSGGSTIPNQNGAVTPPNVKSRRLTGNETPGNSSLNSAQSQQQAQQAVRQDLGLAFASFTLLILFAFILFSIWWRRLFRGYRLPMQIYGRLCLLANWAGIDISRAETPNESIEKLALATPADVVSLRRLGDIYVRELWADPASSDHPSRSGEVQELPGLWQYLQPHLFLYVLRHPSFLRTATSRVGSAFASLRTKRSARKDDTILEGVSHDS